MKKLFAVKDFTQKQFSFTSVTSGGAKPLTLDLIWQNLSDGVLILFRMPFSDLP